MVNLRKKKNPQKLSTENSWSKLLVNCFLETHFFLFTCHAVKKNEFPQVKWIDSQNVQTCWFKYTSEKGWRNISKYFYN